MYIYIYKMVVIALLGLFTVCMAVNTIDRCPELESDIPPPKNVHDLHPSHIKVTGCIGDSITAGVAAKNIDSPYVTFDDFKEYRGLSWLCGIDPDATSISNYIKRYSPGIIGGSTGVRQLRLCKDTFFCMDYGHDYKLDQHNAAVPSGTSNTIIDQVNYLSKYMGADSPHADDWKIVNLYLGTNDISVSCNPTYGGINYKRNIQKGLELLKKNVNKVIVNVVGLAHTEQIPGLTDKKQPGYRKRFENSKLDPQRFECLCCRVPIFGKMDISMHVDRFNRILQRVAKDYGPGGTLGSDTFTVVYQPFNLDVSSLPVEAISNLDGYHPNTVAYRFFSMALWSQMFLSKAEKTSTLTYTEDTEIFCPIASSRIRTD
ncbi:hypothetical protein BCR42DRAFT_414339 [Absidia repens]|uniref:SGNH hydrolase-type esterase domain-containing protein n=1 Tax=Absidia repens TaxID=90262 RepID=A0A1X2IIZ1_9FUNG|nr:hypothetical protein BCR42DRAFT_414339 [Absidia repens]